MKKNSNTFSINNLWTLITIILSFHYYLSYRWISGLLEIYGLNSLSIITIQDIMFSFVNLNYTVIGLCSMGFVILFYIRLTLKNKTYSKADKTFSKNLKKFLNTIFTHKSSKNTIFKIISALLIIIVGYILFKHYLNIPKNGGSFFISLIILFIVIPITYVIWVKKRAIILGGYIFIIFMWSNKFIDKIIVDTQNNASEHKTGVSFIYEGKSIKTNDSLIFILQSYKYLIIKDLKTNKNKLYENENITFLETITVEKPKQ